MPFTRRSIFARFLPGLVGGAGAAILPVTAGAAMQVSKPQKVVYHLSEPGRVNFVLGNIKNHIAGKGGPDKVQIVLVIHGPALGAFVASKASPDILAQVRSRRDDGVAFIACGNTMKGLKVAAADLVDGFSVAEDGGVVRIADLQADGYLYIRP